LGVGGTLKDAVDVPEFDRTDVESGAVCGFARDSVFSIA
jgi:hypothetical protein